MSSSLVLPALLLQATLSYALPVSNPWGGGGFFSFHGSPVAGEDDSTSVAATETATSTIPTPAPDAPSTTAQGNSGRDDVNNAAAVTPDAGADSGSASTKAEHKSSSTSLKTRSSSTSSASASSTDSHSSDVARFQTALLNSASSTINSVPQNSTLPVANITTNNNSDGGLNRTGLAAGITIPIVVLLLVFGTMAYFRIRWRRVNAKGGRVLPSEKGREREIDPESQLTTANSGMGLISGTVTTTTTSGLGTGTVGTVQSVKSRLSFSSLLLLLNANANANREEPPTAAATATSPDAATSPSPRIRTPQAQTPSIRSRFSFSSPPAAREQPR
ncbi:hypothetical protein MKEN_01111100 [Mycena kentingensis (nom. inval.)]|nr:hypothetical protein MKEN_01111100 [Mycena kentingensis (nom. inval.)]